MATIEKIYILQFRNIENQYIKPNKDINLFIGDNAQGKTNLLEALYYLGHNRSFKTKNLKDIIPSNKQSVKIKAEIDGKKVELAKSKNKNTTTLEQQKISNNSKLTHLLPIQIISPDRGFVVGGTPKLKRSYVDWGVFHSQPPILQTYKSYNKTLKNLNTLFSSGECKQNEAWMYKLATFSVEISFARKHYVDKLNQKITKEFSSKLGGEEFFGQFFSFNYSPGWTKGVDELNKESVFSFLQKNINNFAKIKHLNYGPHKASLDFVFKDQTERYFSRGEQKTLSMVFWLTQVSMLVDRGITPVVLIDDVASELDKGKTEFVLKCLLGLGVQVFLTDIGKNTPIIEKKNTSFYKITQGVIEKV